MNRALQGFCRLSLTCFITDPIRNTPMKNVPYHSRAVKLLLMALISTSVRADDFPSARLPPPTGAIDATELITFQGLPMQIHDASLRLPSHSIMPPAPATSEQVSFTTKLRAQLSNDDGATLASTISLDVLGLLLSNGGSGSLSGISLAIDGPELPCSASAAHRKVPLNLGPAPPSKWLSLPLRQARNPQFCISSAVIRRFRPSIFRSASAC